MVRPIKGERHRAGGIWTEARFRSFITSLLRRGTTRWAPRSNVMREARVDRGIYLCAGCDETVPVTVKIKGVRKKNVFVDHIDPVVDPAVGFTTWDEYVERMFCEADNLQVLCMSCHDVKTQKERDIAKQRRAAGD